MIHAQNDFTSQYNRSPTNQMYRMAKGKKNEWKFADGFDSVRFVRVSIDDFGFGRFIECHIDEFLFRCFYFFIAICMNIVEKWGISVFMKMVGECVTTGRVCHL